jgi:alpha-tubulin suppressor-like RCC1 family protein
MAGLFGGAVTHSGRLENCPDEDVVMTKRWPRFSVFLLVASLTLLPLGCRFFSLGDAEEALVSPAPETKGSAKVMFKVVDPDQKANIAIGGEVPAGTVRASGNGAKVTFRLILVDPGAAANRVTTLVKTVTTGENGTAEASFQGIPATSVVGEIVIENGAIGGKNRFHGAGDLTSGDNVLEVSPKGCGHRSDITANVVLAIMQVPELLNIPLPGLVSRIETAGAATIANPTADSYAAVLNAFVTTQVVSDTIGRLTIDATTKKITCSGAGLWTKDATVWENTGEAGAGLEPAMILRQGLGGYGYVAWQNAAKTRAAVTRHKISDGSVEATFVLEGFFQPATVLENGHLILGGTQSGLPLIVRWNGTTATTLTAAGIGSFQADWARVFPGLTANQAVPDAGVEYLEIETGNTGSMLCVVRDPQTRLTRQYRVGLAGTTPEALNQTTTFGAWARGGHSEVTVGWDSVAPTGVTYNLYWALTSDLSPASHTGKFLNVTSPYVHPALTNGQTYHYLVTWVDGGGTEHAQFEKASAKPVAPVVPQGFSKIAAGSTWSIVVKSDGTAWACGMSGDYMGVTGVGTTNTPLLRLQQVARVTDVLAVSTSKYYLGAHSLFLSRNGTVWSVGKNESGELGLGHTTNTTTPEPVPGLPPIVAVAVGRQFSLVLARDGTVWGWGLGDKHQTPGTSSPVQIPGLQDIVAIAAGYDHCLALHRDGTVWGWGANGSGQLGVEISNQQAPVQFPGLTNVVALDAGNACSVFLRSDGKLYACGHNPAGTLGVPAATPLPLTEIPDLSGVTAFSVRETSFLACKTDGTVWSGGYGAVEQVGGLPGGVVAASLGDGHALVMTQDGAVWAWGRGSEGQRGDGTTGTWPYAPPAPIPFDPPTLPPAPTDFKVQSMTGRNLLTWNSMSGTFYRVYYSTTGTPSKNSPYVDAPKSPFTHTGLNDGTTYSYAVSRIDAGGESGLTPVVQGTPGPHRSIADGNWWDGTTWSSGVAPTTIDNVTVEHRVTFGAWHCDARAKTLILEPSGTLVGDGFSPLTIEERFLNKGTLTRTGLGSGHIVVRGDFENQGLGGILSALTFAGPGVHLLSQGTNADPIRYPVYGEAATTTIKAGTDLKFACVYDHTDYLGVVSFPASEVATGTLDMDGHVLQISGRAGAIGLRVDNGIIKNLGGIICQDDAQIVIPTVENLTTPLRIGSKVNLGHLGVIGDVVVVNGGSLVGATTWGSVNVQGNLTVEKGGIVSYEGYGNGLSMNLSGDLHVTGTLSPSGLTLTGTGQQVVSTSDGGKLTGILSVRDANTIVKAGSNLHVDTCRISFPEGSAGRLDMNGQKLTLSGGLWTINDVINSPAFEVTAGKVINVAEMNASSPMNYVRGTFENTTPILVTGDLTVSNDLVVKPGIIVQDDSSLVGNKGRLIVQGSLTNHGTIGGAYNGMEIRITGDLTQNGTYTPSLTTFTGLGTQTLVVGSGKVLPGSYVDADPSFGLQAGSALRFENAFLDLHPQDTIGTGTLDMASFALHLQGGTWNDIGSTEGFGVTRGQIVNVTSINVPSVEAHNENHTRFSNVTFVAADPVVGITMNGAFILRDTITMHGNVTISEGSSLCSYPTLLLKVLGNFSGHVYLADFFSSSLQVQASGFGSITLPIP